MDASVLLGVNMITTFIGRDSKKNVDENIRKQLNMYLKLVELGSPNNLLQTSALVKKENQILDDTLKYLIIELSNTLYDVELNITLDSIVEAISLITGFESVDRDYKEVRACHV